MTTVLIVDDSLTDRRLAGGLLERHAGDWSILYAKDGHEALAQLELLGADLVITDLVMPRMNGRELVQTMRDQFPLIPVVLMTARGSEQIAVKALELGAASYVPKKRLAQDLHPVALRVLASARHAHCEDTLANRMSECHCEFALENDIALISPVVSYLQRVMRHTGVAGEREVQHLGLAIDEALTNAIVHGNLEMESLGDASPEEYDHERSARSAVSPYRERRVRLKVDCTRDLAEFVVRDEGRGYDTSAVLSKPSHSADFDASRGRGLLLMRTFLDELRFNPAGNEVTLVKRRSRER